MRKKSFLILILVTFWFAYSAFSISSYLVQTSRFYEYHINDRKKNIDYQLDLAIHFLLDGNAVGLVSRLQHARESGYFDFFILRKNEEVLGYYNKEDFLEGLNFRYQSSTDFQEVPDGLIKVIDVGDYQLMLGVYKTESKFLWHQLDARKEAIFVDLVLVTVIVFLIVYLLMKDILQISQALQSSNRGGLDKISALSKEGEILLKATEGFEASTKGLKRDNLLLASSLAPAVRAEMRSGKTPPYNFKCTVGRVDLNGYTQLMLEKNPNELLAILNEYFRNARDIIERYQGGLIYQYVGDEIVFIFKETDYFQNSTALQRATSAVRSLFEMAANLKSPAIPEGLRLKSSLVTGELRFVKLDQGYSFSGLPLIESVRMLGQVEEKTESSLIVYQNSIDFLKSLCIPNQSKTTVFKGFKESSQLVEVRSFVPVDEALENLAAGLVADCFRNDRELVRIFSHLQTLFEQSQELEFFQILGSLRGLVVDRVSSLVIEEYLVLLGALLTAGEALKSESKYLASVISLSQNIFSKDQIERSFISLLDQSAKAQDPRVQANVMIVRAHFDLDISGLQKKMSSENNRIAADAILIAGKNDFTADLNERVLAFLNSEKPRFQASGLYIIAALIEFHHDRDLVYLKANKYLKDLSKEIDRFLNHPDEMVRNRAQISHTVVRSYFGES